MFHLGGRSLSVAVRSAGMNVLRPLLIMAVAVTFTTCGPAQAVQDRSVLVRSTQISKVDWVIVNPARITRKIPSTFFGINYVGFWEPAEGSRAAARALEQTPIRTVRFPGGAPGDWYDWQEPYYSHNSRTSPMQLWRWARLFGATRVLFQTNYQ